MKSKKSKKSKIIKTLSNTTELQAEIDEFVRWCDNNGLQLNAKKCKIMTFTHLRNPIIVTYTIKGQPIERVYETTDLGIRTDPKMIFLAHMEYSKMKADNCLGFVKRESYKKLSVENSKLLYETLVRPHLEFANVIWSPSAATHRNLIESKQKQAVIFLHKDNINRKENGYVLQRYRDRCKELGLVSLNRRRVNSAVLWMHKVISGRHSTKRVGRLIER